MDENKELIEVTDEELARVESETTADPEIEGTDGYGEV
jgi:hypothetical protein